MNNANPAKRDLSIDCVKGLAIIVVVFGHLGFYLPSIPQYHISLNPLLFLIKKVNLPHLKNVLAFLGNYSFAIMGLHLLCFKPCILVWNKIFHTSFNVAALVPGVGTQYVAGLLFLAFSCFVPAFLGFVLEKKVMKNKQNRVVA